jgi:hypothetical protein
MGTGLLAAATFWLGWETRVARRRADRAGDRRLLQSALIEQSDNCRAVAACDPARGRGVLRPLAEFRPRIQCFDEMLGALQISGDLASYLVWVRSEATGDASKLSAALGNPWGDLAEVATAEEIRSQAVLLDRLQTMTALVGCEARRRGFPDLASPLDWAPWMAVRRWPDRGRELMAASDGAMRGAPRFPKDRAFASASPEARDRAGAATEKRQQELLSRPVA